MSTKQASHHGAGTHQKVSWAKHKIPKLSSVRKNGLAEELYVRSILGNRTWGTVHVERRLRMAVGCQVFAHLGGVDCDPSRELDNEWCRHYAWLCSQSSIFKRTDPRDSTSKKTRDTRGSKKIPFGDMLALQQGGVGSQVLELLVHGLHMCGSDWASPPFPLNTYTYICALRYECGTATLVFEFAVWHRRDPPAISSRQSLGINQGLASSRAVRHTVHSQRQLVQANYVNTHQTPV